MSGRCVALPTHSEAITGASDVITSISLGTSGFEQIQGGFSVRFTRLSHSTVGIITCSFLWSVSITDSN